MIWNAERVIEQYELRIADLRREMDDLKKLHAAELARVISELDKLQLEYGRLLRVLHPQVQSVELPGEAKKEEPKEQVPRFGGSRWEQLRAAAIYAQEQVAEAQAKREEQHGNVQQ